MLKEYKPDILKVSFFKGATKTRSNLRPATGGRDSKTLVVHPLSPNRTLKLTPTLPVLFKENLGGSWAAAPEVEQFLKKNNQIQVF